MIFSPSEFLEVPMDANLGKIDFNELRDPYDPLVYEPQQSIKSLYTAIRNYFSNEMSLFIDEAGQISVYYGKDGKIFIAEIEPTIMFPTAYVYPMEHFKDEWYSVTVRSHDYHGLLEEVKHIINKELFNTSCIYR